MAFVPEFKYDLFVSYAHADDHAMPGERGWVSELILRLEHKLIQRLGGKKVSIFRDRAEVTANYLEDELLPAARQSALFLAVASPSYSSKSWTRDEFEAFASVSAGDRKRLFTIECLPLGPGDAAYHPLLAKAIRAPFFETSEDQRTNAPINPKVNLALFDSKLNDLAQNMRDKLVDLLAAHQARTPVAQPVAAKKKPREDGVKRVLIAQPIEDLDKQSKEVRDYLLDYDEEVELLPANPLGYPQAEDKFKAAFLADLGAADLFVQLLGTHTGRKSPDLPEGYTRFQYDAAKRSGIPIMQWRSALLEEKTIAAITDTDYRAMLLGEEVMASNVTSLGAEILNRVRKPAKEESPPSDGSRVFISADRNDRKFVEQIAGEIEDKNFTVYLPTIYSEPEIDPTSKRISENLERNIVDCDILVFIYGDTSLEWIESQLRTLDKFRVRPVSKPRLVAVYSGPPPPKGSIPVRRKEWKYISCPNGWDSKPLMELLREVGA